MKRYLSTIAAAVILMLVSHPSDCSAGAKRIVSLKPNITEIVFSLGAGERLAGVTKFCDWPPETKKIPVVADYTRPFVERIIAIHPDIVLASKENTIRRPVETLRSLGFRVELFSFNTIEETLASIKAIGKLIGEEENGVLLADKLAASLDATKKKWAGGTVKKAVMFVGVRPLIAAGKNTFLGQMLAFINVENVIGNSNISYPKIGVEELIANDPDIIINASMGGEGAGHRMPWDGIDSIKAVKDGHVIALDSDALRAGPRLAEAVERLAEEIH